MPEDCGVFHETLMVTFLSMHHLTCPNLNTSLNMCQQDVGAWLIQEAWEEGDVFNIESGG
jgi:hypothetical protein